MKETPIIMTAESVCGILEDRKGQTRRVMRGQPYTLRTEGFGFPTRKGGFVSQRMILDDCPYGKPGDRLWVKETWASGYQNGCWGTVMRADGLFLQGKRQHEKGPHFHAKELGPHVRWRSPLFMPRWASRIALELTDVRIQRVQEISHEDIKAEGVELSGNYRACWRERWNSINAKRKLGWDVNPWVWALTFKRISQ